ncbi:MAG: domain containing protein [Acidobacteriales bacterium]|nr:domain containing protein [Terriglobales bacterium]
MATAAPSTMQTPIHYAGFWIRFVAAFLDSVILGIVGSVIGVFFGGGITAALSKSGNPADVNIPALIGALGTYLLITFAMHFVYHAYFESSEKQATIGKMILGLKVTDVNGQRISFGRATGRFFSKIISAMICYIGFIMAGFTEKKQALHDMLAGTLVVYGK